MFILWNKNESLSNQKNKMKRIFSLMVLLMWAVAMTAFNPVKNKKTNYAEPLITEKSSVVTLTQTESVVNGRPFLPLGLYAVGVEDMPMVKELGFNLVHNYGFRNKDMTEDKLLAYMDAAQKNGLMVYVNLDGFTITPEKEQRIRWAVKLLKNHPALYAWYLVDEPYIKNVKPEDLQRIYDWIKIEDPNHPVINSNWELETFKDCCDLDMRQMYDGVPSKLTPDLEKYLKGSSKIGKPWLAIINAYDSGWGDKTIEKSVNPTSTFGKLDKEGHKPGSSEWEAEVERWSPFLKNLSNPAAAGLKTSTAFPDTPEKIRSSFYWAFVHGSNGLFYWLFTNPKNPISLRWGWYTVFHQPCLVEAIARTTKELNELSRFLINPSKGSISFNAPENPGIFVWSKCVGKERLLVIINETGEDFSGTIDLSALDISSRRLKVYKEDKRKIKLNQNSLTDFFRKEEVHVYFVK